MIYPAYVSKAITFINLQTGAQSPQIVTVPNKDGCLYLADTIHRFDEDNGPSWKLHYVLDRSGTLSFDEPYILGGQVFDNSRIIIYYTCERLTETEESQLSSKKERNKERTIKQVILSIKKWRSYHKTKRDGVRISLLEAANLVGMSKKSLDDYFCQLRLGQQYGFDFASHLDEKIGVLRSFVKKNRPKHQRTNKNEKHPKTLKIIEMFDDYDIAQNDKLPQQHQTVPKTEMQDSDVEPPVNQQEPNRKYVEDDMTPMDRQQERQFRQQFWRLDSILDQPFDPFVQFSAKDFRDFSKKDYSSFEFASKDVDLSIGDYQNF